MNEQKSKIETYRISLHAVRFRGKHGVSKPERELFQDFQADVEVFFPVSHLARRDRYEDVFDYDIIAKLVVQEGTTRSYKLLEILAQHILAQILEKTPALSASISITKTRPPTTPSVEAVSVTISRSR